MAIIIHSKGQLFFPKALNLKVPSSDNLVSAEPILPQQLTVAVEELLLKN